MKSNPPRIIRIMQFIFLVPLLLHQHGQSVEALNISTRKQTVAFPSQRATTYLYLTEESGSATSTRNRHSRTTLLSARIRKTPKPRTTNGKSVALCAQPQPSNDHSSQTVPTNTDAAAQAQESAAAAAEDRLRGILVLLTVPFAWGTYGPVVKYLYEIQPAVPGFVFSACYYAVASLTTLSIVAFQQQRQKRQTKRDANTNTNTYHKNLEEKSRTLIVVNGSAKQDVTTSTKQQQQSTSFPFWGGLELGIYLFVANCFQVVGLKTVPSDRAGFLVQLTTVMVPVAEALAAGNLWAISAKTWCSCLLAFTGICIMNLDSAAGGSMTAMMNAFRTFTQGDVFILTSAVLYTLHVVRLCGYAKETTPIQLAASKATWETIFSTSLVVALMTIAGSASATTTTPSSGLMAFVQETGAEITSFFSTIRTNFAAGTIPIGAIGAAVGATLWTGLVTCAYTIFAQSYGQKRIGPTDANLIYSIQPLCTASFAFFLLRETMGPAGIIGGLFIGAAIYLIVTSSSSSSSTTSSSSSPIEEKVVAVGVGEIADTYVSKSQLLLVDKSEDAPDRIEESNDEVLVDVKS